MYYTCIYCKNALNFLTCQAFFITWFIRIKTSKTRTHVMGIWYALQYRNVNVHICDCVKVCMCVYTFGGLNYH